LSGGEKRDRKKGRKKMKRSINGRSEYARGLSDWPSKGIGGQKKKGTLLKKHNFEQKKTRT